MASSFSKSAAAPASPQTRRKVAAFTTDVHEHAFKGKDGTPTGQTGYAFRVMPVDAEGSVTGMTMWVWLDDHAALAALIASLPTVYAEARKAYQIGVDGEGWPALPKAAAQAAQAPTPTAPEPPKSAFAKAPAKAAPAKSELAAAKAQAIDDGLEEMPF
jgi:hypothetical protein